MSTISQFTFTNHFNIDKLTKFQLTEMGIANYKIDNADTDGDGVLTFEEIATNTVLCDEILKQITGSQTDKTQTQPEQAVPEKNETGKQLSFLA